MWYTVSLGPNLTQAHVDAEALAPAGERGLQERHSRGPEGQRVDT